MINSETEPDRLICGLKWGNFNFFKASYVHLSFSFVQQADVVATVSQSAEQGVAGVVMWGDHLTEMTKTDCLEIQTYIDNFLGPVVKNLTTITQTCSQEFCNSHGRCTFQLTPTADIHSTYHGFALDLTDQWKFQSCKCYNGWSGANCDHQN